MFNFDKISDFFQITFLGNSLYDFLTAFNVFIVSLFVIFIIKWLIFGKLHKIAKKTPGVFDDFLYAVIERNIIPLLYFLAFILSVKFIFLTQPFRSALNIATLTIIVLFAVNLISAITRLSLETDWNTLQRDKNKSKKHKGIITLINILIWGIGIILLLDNLGFEVSAVLAGLGIGGIAIALAAQAVLGDVFSYFAIFFDKPFEIGDFVIVGDYMGTIEKTGIKTTRLLSLSGEEIVFSNSDLTNARVRNYKRMKKRRVAFKFGVTYQTSSAALKKIPDIIRKIVANVKDTVFDRAHFVSYGDFSLVFEVVYYIDGNDYNMYMDIHQQINLSLKEELEKEGIEFAYPTQTLFINKA